jgi:hypothetical protein
MDARWPNNTSVFLDHPGVGYVVKKNWMNTMRNNIMVPKNPSRFGRRFGIGPRVRQVSGSQVGLGKPDSWLCYEQRHQSDTLNFLGALLEEGHLQENDIHTLINGATRIGPRTKTSIFWDHGTPYTKSDSAVKNDTWTTLSRQYISKKSDFVDLVINAQAPLDIQLQQFAHMVRSSLIPHPPSANLPRPIAHNAQEFNPQNPYEQRWTMDAPTRQENDPRLLTVR